MVNLIFVCGNPLVDEDSIVLSFLSRLREDFPGVEFREFDPTEDLEEALAGCDLMAGGCVKKIVYIIDVVKGIDKVTVIDDLDSVADSPKYSVHDYDLAFDLKMLVKMKRIEGAVIFGVPSGVRGDADAIYADLAETIKSTLV